MKETLYVNIFGAPGAGKSTTAAAAFSFLKLLGINAELVTEYAKDLVWEGTTVKLQNQIYIFGKQYQRLFRLDGKVEVAITDSPIMLSTIYDNTDTETFKKLVVDTHNGMNTLNYFVKRVKAYNPKGRMQTAEESDVIADRIENMLIANNIDYKTIDGNEKAMIAIAQDIFEKLRPGKSADVSVSIKEKVS